MFFFQFQTCNCMLFLLKTSDVPGSWELILGIDTYIACAGRSSYDSITEREIFLPSKTSLTFLHTQRLLCWRILQLSRLAIKTYHSRWLPASNLWCSKLKNNTLGYGFLANAWCRVVCLHDTMITRFELCVQGSLFPRLKPSVPLY